MKRIKIDIKPKKFNEWLNGFLQNNNIDIDSNFEEIKNIIEKHLYKPDTTLNRQKLAHEISTCDNIKNIKQIRQKKLDKLKDA